ncbi:MAG: hypothetical protein LBS07_00470 [Prevotellaceae bacterium]|jgi:hypothetical protein|nr:hypothetical protein [Prevotellaceae bacterium]
MDESLEKKFPHEKFRKFFNRFLYGFIIGILLPALFMWVYLSRLYPRYESFGASVSELFPGVLFAKVLLVSILPNLILTFVFYKTDSFKLATGVLTGGMPYLIFSVFML